MTELLLAGLPVPMRVLERRDNGAGTVEIPLLRAGTLDRARTGGGGDGELAITLDDLGLIVRNFESVGRPVPIGVDGHQDFGERAGPQPAFARSLSVRGDVLFGVVDLSPVAFALIVEHEGFRGFSVEMIKDAVTPTGAVEGWALVGGTFTNRPASEVHFSPPVETIAATARLDLTLIRPENGQEDRKVAEQHANLETVQAELEAKAEKVTNLEQTLSAATKARDKAIEENVKLNDKVSALEDKLTAAESVSKARGRTAEELTERMEKQQDQIASLTERARELEKTEKAREIRGLVLDAIRDGVEPRNFEGYKADPVTWLDENFGKVPALKRFIDALPRDEKLKAAASSGAVLNETDTDDTVSLSADVQKQIREKGLEPQFLNVADSTEARKLAAQLAAKNRK